MFGNFFGGGGGGYYDKEYMERIQRERAERQARMEQEQRTIDAETDPTKRLALCRARYRCGEDFATLDDMVQLTVLLPQLQQLPNFTTVAAAAPSAGGGRSYYSMPNDTVTFTPLDGARRKPVDVRLADKISIFRGDITALELDAIVNAANSSLMGGGGIDGAIHSAAGPLLGEECRTLHGCKTGNTKITKGYCLPAKHVLHTVGPIGRGDQKLRGCYRTCLDLVKQHKLRSVAFCCVSTGIFGFPLVRATHIALSETRKWLEEIAAVPSDDPDAYTLDKLDRIVFCVFKATELECYERIAPSYFPIEGFPAAAVPEGEPTDPYQLDDASPDDDYDDDDAMAYPPGGGRGSGGGSGGIRFVGRGHPGAAGGAARY